MDIQRINTEEELKVAFKIREAVFVTEQEVPLEDEFDQYENAADHILVYHDYEPVGTARLRVVEDVAKLERICLLKPYRKLGLGKTIVLELEKIAKEKGLTKAKLHGQTHAEEFYHRLGYTTTSPEFMEDGIPHVVMEKKLI